MSKPIIGITTNLLYRAGSYSGRYVTNNTQDYEAAIFKAGGIPILLPPTTDLTSARAQLQLCDGLLLAGGDDLNPLIYGEQPHKHLGETNFVTDTHHLHLAALALEKHLPLLGICRGMQVLNIVKGGNVYQDLSESSQPLLQHQQQAPRTDSIHTVTTRPHTLLHQLLGSTFPTNSFHHQILDRLGEGIVCTAWTADSVIEGIELLDYPFAVGVQWHPEIMLTQSDSMLPLFKQFITMCHPPSSN